MELKDRKRINNSKLMRFSGGTQGISVGSAVMPTPWNTALTNNTSPTNNGYGTEWGNDATPRTLNPLPGQYPLDPKVQDYMNNPSTGSPTNGFGKPVTDKQTSSVAGMGGLWALGEWTGTGIMAGLDAIGGEFNTNLFVNLQKNQFLADAGTSEGSIGGISYEKQNEVSDAMIQNKKDAFWRDAQTSWLTNPFKAMTMMIGKSSYYDKLEAAQKAANKELAFNNSYNENKALSQYLNMRPKADDNIMYHAKNGKDVETSYGKVNMKPNALVEDGEVIYNPTNTTARVVPGKLKGDNNYSLIDISDVIFTNKYGISKLALRPAKALERINKTDNKLRGSLGKQTDKLVKEQASAQLNDIADFQHNLRAVGMLPEDNNKTIHAAWGWDSMIPQILNTATNVGGAIAQYINLKHEDIKNPNTYRSNPYAGLALQGLNSLRINRWPIISQLYDQQRFGKYNINRSGGLSGAQKALANVAFDIESQRNLANLMTNLDEKDLAYRNQYYNTLYKHGEAERQARTAANRWDLDYYSKAESAKRKMMNQAWNNLYQSLNQGTRDLIQYRQFANELNKYEA